MIQPVPRKKSSIIRTELRNGALYLWQEAGVLRIQPLAESMLRVSFSVNGEFSTKQGQEYFGENCAPEKLDLTDSLQVTETDITVSVATKKLKAEVNKKTGAIAYYRLKQQEETGTLLLRENAHRSRDLTAFDVYRTVINEDTKIRSVETADGVKKEITAAETVFDRTLYHTKLFFDFEEKEVLYGLGQNGGDLNLRHTTQYLHQANLKIAIPLLVSSKGYGIFLTTQGCVVFHDTDEGTFLYTDADEMADYVVIDGNGLDGVIRGFRQLSGKAVMLPRWAFGYIQSKERYEDEPQILEAAEEFRERKIPVDAIVLDWFSWENNMWGCKQRDEKRFPDPAGMMKKLHEKNIHFMLSIWPNMDEKSVDYKEMNEAGGILPGTTLYNVFSEEARKVYWKQAYKGWYQYGSDAWWCDSSEAVTPEWNREKRPQDFESYQSFVSEASKIMPRERINAYGLYHAQGVYEGQRALKDGKRVLNLTRSGYPGSQKFGTVLWSGDTSASYDELKKQIVKGLSFCASGMPYWTMDIGGFFIRQGEQWYWDGRYERANMDPAYCELYVRWYQFGAFLPMFRAHGTDCNREPWHFEKQGEPFYEALLAANRLRYRLMPYIYSLAAGVWLADGTMLRMLAFDFPEDEKALTIKDEFLFGPAFLVAPVTKPMLYLSETEKAPEENRFQTVYLPKGCDWYDYYSKERFTGGQEVTVELTIEKLPLFVRAGSLVPTAAEELFSTADLANTNLTVEVFRGADGRFLLYEDAGDGYGCEQGEYALTELTYQEITGTVSAKTTGKTEFRHGEISWKF